MEKVRKSGVLLNGLPFPLFGANTILQRKVQKIAQFSSFPWKRFFLGERFFHERYTNVILGSQEEFPYSNSTRSTFLGNQERI